MVYSIPYVFSLNYLGQLMPAVIEETINSVSDSLGKLNKSLSGGNGLRFPSDLGSRAVHFKIQTREREKQRIGTSTKPGALIALPIPSNLQTGYGASYGQQGIGVLGETGRAIIQGSENVNQALAELKNQGINALSEQAKAIAASSSAEVAGVIAAAIGGPLTGLSAAALTGLGVGGLLGAGLAVNPHLAVLFEGMNFRNHTFSYKFSARDESESNSLKNIIKEFKNAMHPTEKGLAFFQYPDEFKISFPQDEFLFKVGNSVLTNFAIDYTPDGGSYFHQNGAPVSVSLSLQFTELDILTKDEIAEGR